MILGMQRVDGRLVLSPTDLTKHVACPHITTLDLQALDARASDLGATAADDALNLVFAKGLAHEADYLQALRDQGLSVTEIEGFGSDRASAEAATLLAMREGVDVIYQATLFDGEWVGHADFLLRTDRPSDLGGWSYDIADTKLARRLKVPALLQMAMYAARLADAAGRRPPAPGRRDRRQGRASVAPGRRRRRTPGARRDALLRAIETRAPTESAPSAHCAQCRWSDPLRRSQWLDSDDLSWSPACAATSGTPCAPRDSPPWRRWPPHRSSR